MERTGTYHAIIILYRLQVVGASCVGSSKSAGPGKVEDPGYHYEDLQLGGCCCMGQLESILVPRTRRDHIDFLCEGFWDVGLMKFDVSCATGCCRCSRRRSFISARYRCAQLTPTRGPAICFSFRGPVLGMDPCQKPNGISSTHSQFMYATQHLGLKPLDLGFGIWEWNQNQSSFKKSHMFW